MALIHQLFLTLGVVFIMAPVSCEDSFIVFVDRRNVRQVNLTSGVSTTLVSSGLQNAIALDFDYLGKKLYITERANEILPKKILKLELDKSGPLTLETVLDLPLSSIPDGIALDWINQNLYWTDTGNNKIYVLNLETGNQAVVIDTDLDEPRPIVLDLRADQNQMYWTDWGFQHKIEKSGLDGSNRKVLVDYDLYWPNGLTIGGLIVSQSTQVYFLNLFSILPWFI